MSMFSSGFRRAFASVSRHPSSSKDNLGLSTDDLPAQKADTSFDSLTSEEWSPSLGGNEGALRSVGGKQTLASANGDPSADKLLPGLPGGWDRALSSTTPPEGLPQLTYTSADPSNLDINWGQNPTSSDPFLSPWSQPHVPESRNEDRSTDAPPVYQDETEEAVRRLVVPSPSMQDTVTQDPNILPPIDKETNTQEHSIRTRRSKASFHPFLHNLAVISVTETESPSSQTQTSTTTSSSQKDLPGSPPNSTTTTTPRPQSEDDEQENRKRRKRPQTTFSMLQPIVESGGNFSPPPRPSASSSFSPSTLGLDNDFAKKMEEAGRLRRLQSQNHINSSAGGSPSSTLPQTPVESPPIPEKPQNKTAHLKAHSEGGIFAGPSFKNPPPLPPQPTPSVDPQPNITKNINHQTEDQAALQNLLDSTLRELEAAKEETARATAQNNREKSRLVQALKVANEEVLALRKENQAQKQKTSTLESQLKKAEKDLHGLTQEKQGWQAQLDTMHHQVNQAERQVRCLDHLTRSKLEARQEGVYGATKRSKKAPALKEPSTEVVGAIGALNEEIMQTANLLVENLERTKVVSLISDVPRARTVLGNKVTSMMQIQSSDGAKGFRFLLMQVVLEVFMVHWCTNIIEGWYPNQQSFADLLIELSAKATVISPAPRVDCGKIKILQTGPSTTITTKFPEWAADMIKDLTGLLSVAGLRMRPNKSALFTSKLLALVKIAYDVRTALAEKDICGDLELSVVAPDMPFQAKWMDEEHVMSRKKASTTMQMEPIAGTSGMGLQSGASKQNPTMVLKPKVVLARVLEESP